MVTQQLTALIWDGTEDAGEDTPRARCRPPLLMGDIVARRGGVPELLIQWRRAEGEDDPSPQ